MKWWTTDHDIKYWCSPYGNVTSILFDEEKSGKSQGSAAVFFEEENAPQVIFEAWKDPSKRPSIEGSPVSVVVQQIAHSKSRKNDQESNFRLHFQNKNDETLENFDTDGKDDSDKMNSKRKDLETRNEIKSSKKKLEETHNESEKKLEEKKSEKRDDRRDDRRDDYRRDDYRRDDYRRDDYRKDDYRR